MSRRYERPLSGTLNAGASVTYVVPATSYLELRELLVFPSLATNNLTVTVVGGFTVVRANNSPIASVARYTLNTRVNGGETVQILNSSAVATVQFALTVVRVGP